MRKGYVLSIIVLIGLVVTSCNQKNDTTPPDISGTENRIIVLNEDYNVLENVTSHDNADGDLTSDILVETNINNARVGTYYIRYKSIDSSGNETVVTVDVVVVEDTGYTFSEGVLPNAYSPEIQSQVFAQLEAFYLDELLLGIPVFSDIFNYYTSYRVSLPGIFFPGIGIPLSHGNLLFDDSDFKMGNGAYGSEDTYTLRLPLQKDNVDVVLTDDTHSFDLINKTQDTLYRYDLVDDAVMIVPSLAATDPVCVADTDALCDIDVSTRWQITMRDDLEWFFHKDVNNDFLLSNPDYGINAEDVIDTYNHYVDYDYFTETFTQFTYSLVDSYVIEYTFLKPMSSHEVKAFLTSHELSPISLDLYGFDPEHYGRDEASIGYHGPYYISHIDDTTIMLNKNTSYHHPNKQNYTGYLFRLFETRIEEYNMLINQEIDYYYMGTALETECCSTVKSYQNNQTYTLLLNQHTNVYLGNDNFKKALHYGLNRGTLTDMMNNKAPLIRYLPQGFYLLDNTLSFFNDTAIGEDIYSMYDIIMKNRYNDVELARDYFEQAMEDFIDSGLIEPGTPDTYTVIELDYRYSLISSASEDDWNAFHTYITDTYEDIFVDHDKYVRVEFNKAISQNTNDISTLDDTEFDMLFLRTTFGKQDLNTLIDHFELFSQYSEPDDYIAIEYTYNDVTYKEVWKIQDILDRLNN